LILFLIFASGCGSGGKVAAVVNGRVITTKELDDRVAGLGVSGRSLAADQKDRLLDQLVVESVLLQEANRRGVARDAEVRKMLREAERQILIGRLLEMLRKEKEAPVTEAQVAQFYEANRDNFKQPDSYRVSHILAADAETAKKGLERVKGGEPFAKVAEELSIDPSKSRGGDIGFFSKGQVIPEFEEAAMKLKVGEISGVVQTPLGYHIILLSEKKPAHQKPLEEVKDQIHQGLQGQQGQQAVQSVIQELRSKAQIKIKESFELPK
jgi:peptidyl-prolyl cis-trans isomerase C